MSDSWFPPQKGDAKPVNIRAAYGKECASIAADIEQYAVQMYMDAAPDIGMTYASAVARVMLAMGTPEMGAPRKHKCFHDVHVLAHIAARVEKACAKVRRIADTRAKAAQDIVEGLPKGENDGKD